MDEKRLLALIFAPKARNHEKVVGKRMKENRSGSKSVILQAAGRFPKRAKPSFFAERGEAMEWPNISPLSGIRTMEFGSTGVHCDEG